MPCRFYLHCTSISLNTKGEFSNETRMHRSLVGRRLTRDVHGLDSSMDWIGLGWIGLGPMTVMYKILTVYVFQRNRPRLFYVIISDFCVSTFHSWVLTNIDYEQSSTISWLDLAINMQHWLQKWIKFQNIWWRFRRQNEQWIGLDVGRNAHSYGGLDWILKNGPTDISAAHGMVIRTFVKISTSVPSSLCMPLCRCRDLKDG